MYPERISETELHGEITDATVKFAEKFGKYLAKDDYVQVANNYGRNQSDRKPLTEKIEKLTTSQLRKFFGEVKRQQLMGYNPTSFAMLKPKLAYAVGRAKKGDQNKKVKIEDFYTVIVDAIDKVQEAPENIKAIAFKNFISAFEAIVAYHKASVKE